jgi:hypothetical protein
MMLHASPSFAIDKNDGGKRLTRPGMRWREGTLNRVRAILLVSKHETETRVKMKRI